MNGKEQRRSFRITESVYVKYEELTEEDFLEGLEHRKLRLGEDDGASAKLADIDARLSQAMYKLSVESSTVGHCIMLLNDKLNFVVDQLPGLRKAKSRLAKLPAQTCDIGADGMVFATDKPLAIGSKLHIQFLLQSDNRFFETFCTVVRTTEPTGEHSHLRFGVAVEFHGLTPDQRELLIQHMFNRESETLRLRRLEIQSMEP